MDTYSNKDKYYLTSDLKLQAFLRLMVPDSFIGLNKANPHKVNFVFHKTQKLMDFVTGYLCRKKYLLAPLAFGENIELGKALIFEDY